MRDARQLATRYAGRPILMTADAARSYAERIRLADPRAFQRPRGFDALLRRLGGQGAAASAARQPIGAMDDAEDYVPVPYGERMAYSPRWLGEAEDYGFCWSLHQGVALICCDTALVERGDEWCGEVYHGYDTLLVAFTEASADERVKAIFLRLDSPGGVVVGGLPALAKWIREHRASAGGKPIWVYADMACSAAYWIAAQADRIVAPGVGLVGSIGAVIVHESWAEALEKAGVQITTIQFGERKTDGAWWAELTDTARAALQSDVDQVGRDFIADVVAGRPQLTAEALISTQADAYMAAHDETARSGIAWGFVDAIASEQEAFAALVAEISAPVETNPSPAAPVSGPAPSAATQETPMASTQKPAPKASKAERIAAVQASTDSEKLEKIQQILDEPDEDAPEDEPADTPADDATSAEGDEGQTEAQKITGSAEAKSHPHLALAAVSSGQTLAQFKASVAAAGQGKAAPRGLPGAMANSRRLGPDASAPAGGKGQPSALVRRAEERKAAARG